MNTLAFAVSPTGTNYTASSARQNAGLGEAFKNFGQRLSKSSLGAIPIPARELLLASSLGPGLAQILQEFFMQFVPKATMSAAIRPAMIGYEALLEAPEYLGLYLLPPFVTVICAKLMKNMLGLEHFELLGQPNWKLKEHLGRNMTVGTLKPKTVKIDEHLLSKVSFGKFMLFLIATAVGCAAQVIATAPRVLFIKQFTGGTDNFYAISGLDVPEDQRQNCNDAKQAHQNALQNLWGGLLFSLASVPAVMGLTKLFANRIGSTGRFNKISEVFTLGDGFGISKIMTFFNLAIAPWAYARTALNSAGRTEDLNRLIFFSIPAVLFFQPLAGNFLTWAAAKGSGLQASGPEGVISPPKRYLEEVQNGKREFLNLSLVDLHKKDGQFSGRIESLPQIQELKHKNPARYTKVLNRLHFMNEWGVYLMALAWGMGLNWFNFLNTVKKHHKEMANYASSHKQSQSPIAGLTSQNLVAA